MRDIRQSRAYAHYLSQIGWQVEKIAGISVFIKKFPLLGNFIKIQRPNSLPPILFTKLRENYHPWQVLIEPLNQKQSQELAKRGYGKSRSPYLPSKTLILDLKKSKKNLRQNLSADARQSLRKTENLPLFTSPDLKSFHRSWKKAVRLNRHVPSLNYLQALQQSFKSSSLFIASHNYLNDQKYGSTFVSGAIFLQANDFCYYWQAFTSPQGRVSLAQYRLLWQGILWGKSKGAKYFDFEGIYDPRFPQKSWLGFTQFKKKFGGQEKQYPPPYLKFCFWG